MCIHVKKKVSFGVDYGELYDTIKRFKMQCKYAVRRLKRGMEVLNGGHDIDTEIKKIRVNVKVTTKCVNGVTGSENISSTFASIKPRNI